MSRAFTKEDAQQEDVVVVARAPLPEGEPNLVTPRGLELLREEERVVADALAAAVASGDERRIAALETVGDELALRLASAELVDPAGNDKLEVRFGDAVTLRPVAGDGQRTPAPPRSFTLTIVGVDEADPEEDLISFLAPLAKAMLGARVGDRVTQGAGPGSREVEVVEVD